MENTQMERVTVSLYYTLHIMRKILNGLLMYIKAAISAHCNEATYKIFEVISGMQISKDYRLL